MTLYDEKWLRYRKDRPTHSALEWGGDKDNFVLPRKMSYLSEYESYRAETGVKIFLGSIPKTFSLTPKRFSE